MWLHSVLRPDGGTETTTYTTASEVASFQDPGSHTTSYVHDGFGDVVNADLDRPIRMRDANRVDVWKAAYRPALGVASGVHPSK